MTSTFQDLLKTVVSFLRITSFSLFTIALCSILAAALLIIGKYIEPDIFLNLSQVCVPILSIIFIFSIIAAISKLYAEKNVRTVNLVPSDTPTISISTQIDKRKTTSIICNVHVYNLTDKIIYLSKNKLSKPEVNVEYLHDDFIVRQQDGKFYSSDYAIPPRGKTLGQVHLMINSDISGNINKSKVVRIEVLDQYGNRNILEFTNVKISYSK